MIYDYFRFAGAHDTVLVYADLFTITLRNDDVQEFDMRWDGIQWSMTKIPPGDVLESLYNLRICESDQLNTELEMRELKHGQWLRIAGVNVVLKEDKEFAISGKHKGSVREETSAVSGTTVMSVHNRHQKPLHPLSHQHQEVEVRRENGASEAGVCLGSSLDSRAEIT